MTLCCQRSLVKQDVFEPEACVLRCNLWKCEHCQPYKQRALKRICRAGQPDTFITLTCRAGLPGTPAEHAQQMVRAWRLIVKRAKRKFKIKKLPYLAIFERHENGEPHIHILARVSWLPQRWLSAAMDYFMQSPIVDIRRVKSVNLVVYYVAKYISKKPAAFRGCKRWWRSLDWIVDRSELPDNNPVWRDKWVVANQSLTEIGIHLTAMGYALEWEDWRYCRGIPRCSATPWHAGAERWLWQAE